MPCRVQLKREIETAIPSFLRIKEILSGLRQGFLLEEAWDDFPALGLVPFEKKMTQGQREK